MKPNRKSVLLNVAGIAAGAALIVAGVIFKDNAAKEITGVCFGLGAGLLGMFLSNLITMLIEARSPEAARAKSIAVNDERNAAIRDKAGAQANKALGVVLPIVTLVFVLMNVELSVTLIMCGLILLRAFISIYYHEYYNKRM